MTNEAGISRTTYRKILVGEKCNVVFQLHDDGGNGWKGAAISVTSESGQRIAVVTMTQGSALVVDLPLLRGNLNFIWNHGWYHAYEEHDTDGECSFTILDYAGNELYTSADLEDGVFMTYDNNCEEAPLACYPVQDLQGEYEWHSGEEYGALVTWDRPNITTNLHHFKVVRSINAYKAENELIAEIPYDDQSSYSYYDNTYDIAQGDVTYSVNCVYIRNDEQCESEYRDVLIDITAVDETSASVNLYPNPTNRLLHIEGQGTMHICVSNLLGQKLQETTVNDNTILDLSRYESGMYLVRIENENGVMTQKVNLRK